MRAARVAPALALAALAGCASLEDDDWRFAASRATYDGFFESMDANEPVFDAEAWERDDSYEGFGVLVLPAILALPLAIDLVLLPVTIPRDALAE